MKTNMGRFRVSTIERMVEKVGYDKTVDILLQGGGGDIEDGLTLIQFHDKKHYNYNINELGESK